MKQTLHFFPFVPPGRTTFELFMMIAEMSSTGICRMLFFCASGIFPFSQCSTMLFAIAPFFIFPTVIFTWYV